MDRRDLLKLIAISPLTRALQAGTVTEVEAIQTGEVDVTSMLLTDSEVLQLRKGETRAFDIPECKSLTVYAEEENDGPIFFGAEKVPASVGMKLDPGRQFIAKDLPAATLYAVGPQDALLIVTFKN